MGQPDYVIAGAGVIGLSLALELHCRGARVVVLERGRAAAQTSFAAAGMLAVEDTANPPELYPLARLSVELYPEYLDRVGELAGERVPFQTRSTLEAVHDGDADALKQARELVPQLAEEHPPFRLLAEQSVDPRQLGAALRKAVFATAGRHNAIDLRELTALRKLAASAGSMTVLTDSGTLEAAAVIDCMGTWSPAPVVPCKGQMLAVEMPAGVELTTVVRTPDVYVVPRTEGPHAGRVIIGATLEDAGFDTAVHALDMLTLHAHAVKLLPVLADAVFLESWAGLRPMTADGLPLLGRTAAQPRYVLATGHYRNGILLAPATARVIADLLLGAPAAIDLVAYSPGRAMRNTPGGGIKIAQSGR